jgi:hypothetical protein
MLIVNSTAPTNIPIKIQKNIPNNNPIFNESNAKGNK